MYYPSLIYRNSDIIFNALAMLGIFLLAYQSQKKWGFSLLLLGVVALLFNSVMNIFSGPPSAAPDRYSLFYMIILAFYVAIAIDTGVRWGLKQETAWRKYGVMVLILGLIGTHLLWQGQKTSNFPQGMALDSVAVGRQLNQLLQENDVYMVELRYWDFLAIQLLAGPHHHIIYDREFDLYNRQTISIFAQDKTTICSQLQIPDFQYLVLQDTALKTEVQQLDNFVPLQEVGRWTIYELHSNIICN
ncbi:MAG: hypothetical protein IPL28_24555 [Chloroflexi bacterium]|nr:hypothetical protein [Chloroflexota bacterium]